MIPCLYVASPSYSGSTLLTMLLAEHPEVATIGEMKGGQEDLSSYRCSCGALFAACPFRLLTCNSKERQEHPPLFGDPKARVGLGDRFQQSCAHKIVQVF